MTIAKETLTETTAQAIEAARSELVLTGDAFELRDGALRAFEVRG